MTNKEKIKRLQEIIREGIGDRTKRVFAFEAGITPEHFSRLMKSGYDLIPNEKTIVALARALPNTTEEEMFSLFEIKPTIKIENKRPAEISNEIYLELRDDKDKLLLNNRLYESADDFIKHLMKFSLFPNVQIHSISGQSKRKKSDYLHSKLVQLVYLVEDVKYIFSFVVDFYKVEQPEKGTSKVLIERLIFDKDSIQGLGFEVTGNVNSPYVCLFEERTAEPNRSTSNKVSVLEYGVGFRIANKITSEIEKFVEANSLHLDSFDDEPTDFFEKISLIMNEKTKIPFTFYKGEEVVSIYSTSLELNEMTKAIVEKYAKELGAEQYGKIHVLKEVELEEDELFEVEG